MFCQKCGAEIPEGKKFCADCGTPVAAKENNGKNNKIILIVFAAIAIVAIACAVVFGVKLIGEKNPEQSTTAASTTTASTTVPTTTEITTVPTTTTPALNEYSAEATTKKAKTTKANSDDFVIGKEYKNIPINIKSRNFFNATWRGYVQECEDAEFKVFYDKNYNVKSISAYYHKPSLKGSLIKSVDITYSSKGDIIITATNYLGYTGTYTEEDFIEMYGADGVKELESIKLSCSDGLFINPLAKFEEFRPDLIAGISGYKYLGKETLKTGDAYKFEVDSPNTGETLFIWIDKKTGAMAKMTILYQGKDTLYFEASEINAF